VSYFSMEACGGPGEWIEGEKTLRYTAMRPCCPDASSPGPDR
jgi:hypothetical protein